MFDATTAGLIRRAPAIGGIDTEHLPQDLTAIYAEIVAARVGVLDDKQAPPAFPHLERLQRIATLYESLADQGASGDQRRASAFVSGSANQLIARAIQRQDRAFQLLEASFVSPILTTPLLFLIAEQNADAREAAASLVGIDGGSLLRTALIECVADLASERFEEIAARGHRLPDAGFSMASTSARELGGDALYGLCYAGIVQLASELLDREVPKMRIRLFDTPQRTFAEVIRIASNIGLGGSIGGDARGFAGPRHLATLLLHVADGLDGASLLSTPSPQGTDPVFWKHWCRNRAKSKPILWRNHRKALSTGFLDVGKSAVLVLPTGAGKTTLSELKIAACIGSNRKVIFLVPTLALVDQLRDELAEAFQSESLEEIGVSSDGDLLNEFKSVELQSIEVMTPERCLALLVHAAESFENVGLIVFDECHLMTQRGGGKRSIDAMLCLLTALNRAPSADFLLLSAMLTNSQEIAAWLQEVTERPCAAFQDPWKPSRQARGVVVYPMAELFGIRASVLSAKNAKRSGATRQRVDTGASPFALFGLHQHWHPNSPTDWRLVRLLSGRVPLSIGSSDGPAPNANQVAAILGARAAASGIKTIIFVQQASHAPSTAERVSEIVPGSVMLSESEERYWSAIKQELGGEEHSLVRPSSSALPHNGDMIALERRLVEAMFRRADGPKVVVATPTLAQGMNLPAQLVLLAGDKRHDASGRSPLESHEILNAAGRAGRAGHLANGVVLLIPEPVAGFNAASIPDEVALQKLKAILPPGDQCLEIEDPLGDVLDRITLGDSEDVAVQYVTNRLLGEFEQSEGPDAALSLLRKSLAGFQAKRAGNQEQFEMRLSKLGGLLSVVHSEADRPIVAIAAASGLSQPALLAVRDRILEDFEQLPTSIVGWTSWFIDFISQDSNSASQLLGDELSLLKYLARGVKSGPPLEDSDFARIRTGLVAWLEGRPFVDIEVALGVAPSKVGCCMRARDLALKAMNRNLYIIISAIADVAAAVRSAINPDEVRPAYLRVLGYALRKGLNTPEKVAYSLLAKKSQSRVQLHADFGKKLGEVDSPSDATFDQVLSLMKARLAFSAF
jgi:hypothetical protein